MAKPLPIPLEELRDFIMKNAGKKTAYQMHKELGVAIGTISSHATDMNISLAIEERVKKRDELRAAIIQFAEKYTASEIAKMMNAKRATVYYMGWAMRISFKPDEKNPVKVPVQNPNVFNVSAHENWIV